MEGTEAGAGAADMVGLWQKEFDYSQDGPFLVLSGGDMWTGPAVSTWFEGASMVQVMNAMGYDAAAPGNHEFDFGLDTLAYNIEEMDFPILGANIRYKSDGRIPTDIGIQPYTLVEVSGVTVGVIGLAGTNTPQVTSPAIVAPFDFIDYEDALREIVPEVRAAGAEIIVVPTHRPLPGNLARRSYWEEADILRALLIPN
jgi:5'-nucleotidase